MGQYLGEIRLVSFNFAPKGWALCNGQLMSIQQNAALFAILGTFFGGNGVSTFALPDLRGRVPLHVSPNYPIGTAAGVTTVTLIQANLPPHNHLVNAVTTANSNVAGNDFPATAPNSLYYVTPNPPPSPPPTMQTMNAGVISPAGQNLPHNNMQPYLVMNYIICLVGIFPSRN